MDLFSKLIKMFGGVHELMIDDKGRLAIPSKFRERLNRGYSNMSLVVTLDARHRLLLYPESVWIVVAKQFLNLKVAGNRSLQLYQNLLLHNAETLDMDSANRVLLPARLRKMVLFEREVCLVGHGNRMELWGKSYWEAEMEKALDIDAETLARELAAVDICL